MREYPRKSIMILLLGLVILWTSCGGPAVEPTPKIAETTSPEPTAVPVKEDNAPPDWFLNVPEDSNYMYAAATGSSKLLDLAFDNAKNEARIDLANQMSVSISGMFKRFREESGAGEDAELRAITTTASKAAVEELLKGAKTIKQHQYKEDNIYHAYVLMSMSAGTMKTTVVEKIKGNKDLYTQFRASQGFNELESEVEKHSEKKEQG